MENGYVDYYKRTNIPYGFWADGLGFTGRQQGFKKKGMIWHV